jgi:hypothetical protein
MRGQEPQVILTPSVELEPAVPAEPQTLQEQAPAPVYPDENSATLVDERIYPEEQPAQRELANTAFNPAPSATPPPVPEPAPTLQPAAAAPPAPPATPLPVYAPHAFQSAQPAAPAGSYPPPRKKSALPAIVIGAVAALAIAVAVWFALPPKREDKPNPGPTPAEIAQQYVTQGRGYLAASNLDDAEAQADLALQTLADDPAALQLKSDIRAQREAIAASKAAEARKAEEAEQVRQQEQARMAAAAEREAAEKVAQQLVADGEKAYPADLATARAKADQAMQKVPDHAGAKVLLAKVNTREKQESQRTAAIAAANKALQKDDPDAAERALADVPAEFSGSPEVTQLRDDIQQKRREIAAAAVPKATPPPRKPRVADREPEKKKPESTKPKSPRTVSRDRSDDDDDRRSTNPPPVQRTASRPPAPKPEPEPEPRKGSGKSSSSRPQGVPSSGGVPGG